jgi:hypothetical protein
MLWRRTETAPREICNDLARRAPAGHGAQQRLGQFPLAANLLAADGGSIPGAADPFLPSIHLTLNHILVVDWYYLDALDNDGRRWREIYAQGDAPCPTFADVRREQTAADRRLIAYSSRRRGSTTS